MESRIWNKSRIWNTFAADRVVFRLRGFTVVESILIRMESPIRYTPIDSRKKILKPYVGGGQMTSFSKRLYTNSYVGIS